MKRSQSDFASDDAAAVTPSPLASTSSGSGSSKRAAVSGVVSASAATDSLSVGLEQLAFEDEFEDEFDGEEAYLKRLVTRKELKKRREREDRRRQLQAGDEKGSEGAAVDDVEGEDEEDDYNDVDDEDEEEGGEEKDEMTEEQSAEATAPVADQPEVDVEQHERRQKASYKDRASKQSSKVTQHWRSHALHAADSAVSAQWLSACGSPLVSRPSLLCLVLRPFIRPPPRQPPPRCPP